MTDREPDHDSMGRCWRIVMAFLSAATMSASEHLDFTVGAHYDSLCLATVSAAVQVERGQQIAYFLQASPGLHGYKLSIGGGYEGAFGVCGPTQSSWVNAFLLTGKLTYLRTWDPPRRFASQQNFLGFELEGAFILGGTIGIFRGINPGRHGAAWTAGWSAGIGL